MDGLVSGLVGQLDRSGVIGTVIAGVIVALVLAIILVGHFKGLWVDLQGRTQSVELQARLLKLVEIQQASETALRLRLAETETEKDGVETERDDLRCQIDLLRHQRRRLLDIARRLRPAAGRAA